MTSRLSSGRRSSMLNGKNGSRRLFRVELVGPAGVGKTTLAAALLRRREAASSTIWGLPVVPLLRNGAQLLPTFVPLWRNARTPLWEETRHIVRLRTLNQAFRQPEAGAKGLMLLEEGPIFALVWLRGFGHETMRSEASAGWWQATLREWAAAIDAIVVLEAPDSMLARRIRTRPETHEVKELADAEIAAWMARFRVARDWVLAGLAARGGPIVLRMATEQESPERIADRILKALDQSPHAN